MSFFTSAVADLSRRLLAGGSSTVLGVAHTFLRDTIKDIVDEMEERLRKKAVSYVAAGALALVAAASIVSTVSAGLVALGMPPWSAHLVLAVATGAAAWVCYAMGRARRVIPTGDADDRENDSEDHAPRGVTIKIVNQVPRAKPRRKKRRLKSRRTKPRPPKKKKFVRTARVKAA